MDNIKITVIIPCYNVEKYIRFSLDSLIKQDFADWEAILIDDGSTDTTGYICDIYAKKDSRFRVLHKKNGGVSSARNTGLRNVRGGDLITFLDPDDWFEPDTLRLYWDEYIRTNADAIQCSVRWVWSHKKEQNNIMQSRDVLLYDDNKKIVSHYIPLCIGFSQKAFDDFFTGGVNIYTKYFEILAVWNFAFSRKKIMSLNLMFDESMRVYEDVFFLFLFLLSCKRVVKMSYKCYNYFQHEKSTLHIRNNKTDLLFEDKCSFLRVQKYMRSQIDYFDVLNCYCGSHVLSCLNFIIKSKTQDEYIHILTFIKDPEVQESIKRISIRNIPYWGKIPVVLLKFHLQYLLFLGCLLIRKNGGGRFLDKLRKK